MFGGLLITFSARRVFVCIATPGVASVVSYPIGEPAAPLGPFVPATRPASEITTGATATRLIGPGIVVEADRRTGRLSFAHPQKGVRIAETSAAAPIAGVSIARVQSFAVDPGDALYGFGQFREPDFDYRGKQVFLGHANTDAVNPLLVSTGGWALLWETGTAAYFRAEGARISFDSIAGDVIRYHVVIGDDIDAQIGGYRRLTGKTALLGKWAYGYWQSKERYRTQGELTEVVDQYRARGLPLDTIVLDWHYWGENDQFSGMTFDPATFPHPDEMIEHVHRQGVHIIASVWPAFGPKTAIYRDMAAAGRLFAGRHWSGGKVFDATAPDAQAIYWRHIDKGLMAIGMDGLWTDGCEPEFMSTNNRYATARSYAANGDEAAGPIVRNLLTYSAYQSRCLSDNMRRVYPERRPLILTRSAYPGQQAYGAVTWSGDIFASWGTLRHQVVAAMNFALSGHPHWTCDIGGFLVSHRYPDGLADPAYTELYVRWFQWGAFLPVFRAHGTDVPRELWHFGAPGEPVYEALKAALEQRYALMPYIYSAAARAAIDDDTMMRPLVMDFADDDAAIAQRAQYMFGRDLLVRVVDRPLFHATENIQEFVPNTALQGLDAPASEITFFEGVDFDKRVARQLTDDFKLSWAGDLPAVLAGKPYSLRWTGRLIAQEAGRHRIIVTAQGTVRLTLDGKRHVDGKAPAGDGASATGAVSAKAAASDRRYTFDVDLVAGKSYPFVLEQRQQTPDAVSLWVEWITPNQRSLSHIPDRKTVPVYLPAGSDWYDFHSFERHAGDRMIEADAPLSRTPVYARAGAIIPMTPGITRAMQPIDAIELHVFAGRDGAFTLYDDAGDGDGYLRGQHTRTPIAWRDRALELAIGAREGSYPDMPGSLRFNVILHDGEHDAARRGVTYSGAPVTISLRR
ncbi:DUF5110 domain-containing protein [Sphingomonas koreensis]|nr:DUF5110 domain-containing protein [Sphingomonas koreensis]